VIDADDQEVEGEVYSTVLEVEDGGGGGSGRKRFHLSSQPADDLGPLFAVRPGPNEFGGGDVGTSIKAPTTPAKGE